MAVGHQTLVGTGAGAITDISSTGVLVETGSEFAPGSTTNLQLCGPDTNLVVPVRFIRSDVSRIRRAWRALPRCGRVCEGARYRLARQARSRGGAPATTSAELAALFSAVLSSAAMNRRMRGLRRDCASWSAPAMCG